LVLVIQQGREGVKYMRKTFKKTSQKFHRKIKSTKGKNKENFIRQPLVWQYKDIDLETNE